MDLSSAADELYGVAPEEFVETRRRLAVEAKEAGDRDLAKRIGVLRRPTASAWAINLLARSSPDELGWLFDVGVDLRAAWAVGGHVGGLDQRRGELIEVLSRAARALAKGAGRPLRESAAREVEETLHAAVMDPTVADEVRSGQLTQPRSHVGFVPAGVPTQHVTRPGDQGEQTRAAPAERRPDTGRAVREREQLAERARTAANQVHEAEQELAERESQADAAERVHADVAEEAERLQRHLDDVLDRRDAALQRLRVARRERDRAAIRVEQARRRSEKAHRGLPTR